MSNFSLDSCNADLENAPLGQQSEYLTEYSPTLLFPISRKIKRDEIAIPHPLPFKGYDTWNAFELSWLNKKGKPIVAMAEFIFPCESINIIESKSFKLYLNSLNNTKFESHAAVKEILEKDLSKNVGTPVCVKILDLNALTDKCIATFEGDCLDSLDIECSNYVIKTTYLTACPNTIVEEKLFSHLLKSNCLVTGQPDWGSISLAYKGPKINREGLLKYIVSFRNHHEFHEQCVERIFMDILNQCHPQTLTVEARYTRRGGLDINPVRSTHAIKPTQNIRMARQ